MTAIANPLTFSTRRRMLGSFALLAAACLPLPLSAQEVPTDLGFIRLVNAIGLPGRLMVRINGSEADPEGYKQGDATGALGLSPKTYQVELAHEGLGKETVQVAVQSGQITTVIAFKSDKPKDPKAKKTTTGEAEKTGPSLAWYLDQAAVTAPDQKDATLTLLQLTPTKTITFSVSGTPALVPEGTPVRVAITRAMGAFPEVHLQGKAVCLLNFKEPADQLVVFYSDENGGLKQAQLRNDIQ